jgi:hypothetical protein
MLRKSLLFVSMISFAALMVWSFALRGVTPASASATSATFTCARPSFTLNQPVLQGTPANPTGVRVTWSNVTVPDCYRISEFKVTFNAVLRNGDTRDLSVTVPGNATQAQAAINTGPVPPGNRPTVITATVVAVAVPIEAQLRKSETAVKQFNN